MLRCIYCAYLTINNNTTVTIKYADETYFIVTISKTENEPECLIHNIMEWVSKWCNSNCMLLNSDKTKVLNISFVVSPWVPDLELKADMNFITSLKILGVSFSDKLTWDIHINSIVEVCSQRLAALRILKRTLTFKELNSVYCATIQSVFEYYCQIFVCMPQRLKDRISKIFRRAHRIICGNCNCVDDTHTRRLKLTQMLFNNSVNKNHILHSLIPHFNANSNRFIIPHCRTSRKVNSFSVQCSILHNSV